jgi:hypothetical protein
VRVSTRRIALLTLTLLALSVTGSLSAHASCPLGDVVCQADEAIEAGGDLIDDTTDPIETPLDEAIEPVINEVRDLVDELLGDAPIDLPDPIGDRGGGGGGNSSGPPVRGHSPDVAGPGGGTVGGPSPDGAGIPDPPGTTISAASGTAPADRGDRTSGTTFGDALEGVARSLAIVLVLFGLAVAFVAIQDRLDRTDPRLALAPVESDVVEFG